MSYLYLRLRVPIKDEMILSNSCYRRWPFVSSLCGNVSTLIKMSIRHKKNIAAHFRGIYQGNKDKGVKQDYIEEGKTSTPTIVTFFVTVILGLRIVLFL